MYRIIPHIQAQEAIAAMPSEALAGYAEAVGVMKLVPWNGKPFREDNPDANILTLPFGNGGMVTYMVLDRDREVHVLITGPKATWQTSSQHEAEAPGKDTQGMQRLHEFHKAELVRLCLRDEVENEFFALLVDAERALELPHRVVDLCTGDVTFSSARIYDLELYAPGLDKWLEVSSVESFPDLL